MYGCNPKFFKFFGLVSKSPIHTGKICVYTSCSNISCFGSFQGRVFYMYKNCCTVVCTEYSCQPIVTRKQIQFLEYTTPPPPSKLYLWKH
jgi:hypothetical protein